MAPSLRHCTLLLLCPFMMDAFRPLIIGSALVFLYLAIRSWRRASRLPLPPGPKGYPIIGSLLDGDHLFDWTLGPKHRKQWGDITSVTSLGSTIVNLHTYEKAVELLDKKSLIYSSRPTFHMYSLSGWRNSIAFLPYGQQLRECRKMLATELNNATISNFHQPQQDMAKRLLSLLFRAPEQFYDRTMWYAASSVLKNVYGYDTLEDKDPMINIVEKFLSTIATASEEVYWVEYFPWLQYVPAWFPFVYFKRDALRFTKNYEELLNVPFEYAASHDENENNFSAKWLKKISSQGELALLKETSVIFIVGGVDSSTAALQTFFFRMQEYPHIQKIAQAELDDVVGRGRLPSFQDRENLPYINALCKEILRHNPPGPIGLAHKTTADDIHDGMYIPKGSTVVSHLWEMSRDIAIYSDPDTFNPERFLGPNPEMDPSLFVFGFGRRICSGIPLADATLFISVAMLLAAFDITPPENKMDAQFSFLLPIPEVSTLAPFKCGITPREGVNAESLLESV